MDKLAKMDGLEANMQMLLQTLERNTKTVRQAESKMNTIKSLMSEVQNTLKV